MNKDLFAKPHISNTARMVSLEKPKEQEESTERVNKENRDERQKTPVALPVKSTAPTVPIVPTPKAPERNSSTVTDVLRINTNDEGSLTSIVKEG